MCKGQPLWDAPCILMEKSESEKHKIRIFSFSEVVRLPPRRTFFVVTPFQWLIVQYLTIFNKTSANIVVNKFCIKSIFYKNFINLFYFIAKLFKL